ncbi:MAG: heavy metal-binding domain-containing protein [Candidatus Omnitrophota bacterium]
MIVVTTPSIQGKDIRAYKGLVTGDIVVGVNFLKDWEAGIKDALGGRVGGYEKDLQEAKRLALAQMTEQAENIGANAIVGVNFQYAAVGQHGTMLLASAVGTAVVID